MRSILNIKPRFTKGVKMRYLDNSAEDYQLQEVDNIFNPSWEMGDVFTDKSEVCEGHCTYMIDCYETCHEIPSNSRVLLIEKSKVMLTSIESIYTEIIDNLFIINLYYSVKVRKGNNKVEIKPISYMKEYLLKLGYSFYWESLSLNDIFIEIPAFNMGVFNCYLQIEELWEGTGLWDFINNTKFIIYSTDGYENFKINEKRALNTITVSGTKLTEEYLANPFNYLTEPSFSHHFTQGGYI